MKVYVMEAGNGLVKVGVSANVERRRKQLERVHDCRISVIFESESVDRLSGFTLEKYCHVAMGPYREDSRAKGEWFNCDPALAVEAVRVALEDGFSTYPVPVAYVDPLYTVVPAVDRRPTLQEIAARGAWLATH